MSSRQTLVLFTCDVECSIGNSGTREHPIFRPWPVDTWIWGKLGGSARDFGIGLLMEQLERVGAVGTFYVSALERHFHGDEALAHVAQEIERRGHEAGVHIHCAWEGFHGSRRYELSAGYHLKDSIADHSEDEQRRLLTDAAESLERWTGRAPKSFRAGNFGADLSTLRVLAELGLTNDSSRNAAIGALDEAETINRAREVEGLLEIPATTFEAARRPRRLLRFVDPSNMTVDEARRVFDQVASLDIGTLVLVTHSFQYVSPGHVAGERVAPHEAVVERVDRILDMLAEDERFRFVTARDAAELERGEVCRGEGIPETPGWLTALRLAQASTDITPGFMRRFHWE